MLIDSTSLPYIRPCGQQSIEGGTTEIDQTYIGVRNMTLFNNRGSLKISSEVIGYDSFRLHEQFATKLNNLRTVSVTTMLDTLRGTCLAPNAHTI